MMKRSNYNTKQRQAVLEYLELHKEGHVTASEICEYLNKQDTHIGITTIYRHLDRLVEEGRIKKYMLDRSSGACYQYVDDKNGNKQHYHLKCEGCGELLHMECEYIDGITSHILSHHDFQVDTSKTIFYGRCDKCKV